MPLTQSQKSTALLVGGISALALLGLWLSKTKVASAAAPPITPVATPAPPSGNITPPPQVTTGRTSAGPIYGPGQSILIVGDENAKAVGNALYPLLAAKYPGSVPLLVFAPDTLATQSIANLGSVYNEENVPKTDIALVIAGAYDAEKGGLTKEAVTALALRLLATTGGHNPAVVFVLPPPRTSVTSFHPQGYVQPYFLDTDHAVFAALSALSPHGAVTNWYPPKDTSMSDDLRFSPAGAVSVATLLADYLTKT